MANSHPLDDAYARLGRAWTQLEQLKAKIRAWALANRYDFPLEYDAQLKKRVLVARSPDPANPIGDVPLEFGVIAGDALNNLRSALNYVVWRLALARGTTHDQLQFPIIHDFGTKRYEKSAADRFPDMVKRYHLDLVGSENLAFIQRMQPYNGRHWEPLAFLADLNDMDKHRVIATQTQWAHIDFPKFYGVAKGSIVRVDPRLHEGANVVIFERYIPDPNPEVNVHFRPHTLVLFGPAAKRLGNVEALQSVARVVSRILLVFHERAYPRVSHGRGP